VSVLSNDYPARVQRRLRARRWRAALALKLGAPRISAAGRTVAATSTHKEWLEADNIRAAMVEDMAQAFETYDVILAPATPVAAFPHDHRAFDRRRLRLSNGRRVPYGVLGQWVSMATVLGLPVTTVPAGLTEAGLPVGVQIIGAGGGDARTLAVAQAAEEHVCGFEPPTPPATSRQKGKVDWQEMGSQTSGVESGLLDTLRRAAAASHIPL
jgi:amidase